MRMGDRLGRDYKLRSAFPVSYVSVTIIQADAPEIWPRTEWESCKAVKKLICSRAHRKIASVGAS